MNFLLGVLVAAFLILVGYSYYEGEQYEKELGAFIRTCNAKGGIVLSGHRNEYNGWHGCYKGLTEIENEVK